MSVTEVIDKCRPGVYITKSISQEGENNDLIKLSVYLANDEMILDDPEDEDVVDFFSKECMKYEYIHFREQLTGSMIYVSVILSPDMLENDYKEYVESKS